VIHTARAESPLKLLLPLNHGDAAWTFITNFGGGLVDGDRIDLRVDVGRDARALLSTQAATKVYRSERHGCMQRFSMRVENGGFLASIADPVVCFAGARYFQAIDVSLGEGASFVLLDTLVSGRVARDERWAFHDYSSRTVVERADRVLLHEAMVLNPLHGDLTTRMGRFDVLTTLIAIGPETTAVRERLLASAVRPERDASRVQSASSFAHDGVIARVAATSTAEAVATARALLRPLVETLGDDPFARKW
jgi:urease accessory protein